MHAKPVGNTDGAKAFSVGAVTACSASGAARYRRVAGVNGLLAKRVDLMWLDAGIRHGLGGPDSAQAGLFCGV